MKKMIIVVLAILMLTFAGVSAQETDVAEQILNFDTVGEMVAWTTTAEEIYNILSEYENLEINVEDNEEYGKLIEAQSESEEEAFSYVFYFDNDTELLWEVECVAVLYDGEKIVPAFQALYESYGFEDAEPYQNDALDAYVADYDESYIVAGDGTIAALAGKAETEESYGSIALVLINREYFES
ncbi:MAG: hypothetical protein IJI14_20300 [Anaerolineaceae bacterium]|nr:hypothetical protein [Anaerolineaceae bacterium]